MPIHHVPWSQRFLTLCCAGSYAYEVQVGPLVIQWFYKHHKHKHPRRTRLLRRLHLWRDPYWRA
jgi:hypothetical protein